MNNYFQAWHNLTYMNVHFVLKDIQEMLKKEHLLEQTLLSKFCVLQDKVDVRFLLYYLILFRYRYMYSTIFS